MIWETAPWKRDLAKWHARLSSQAEKYHANSYITVEKAIFYSAFIMRKLFDCQTKISGSTSHLKIPVKRYLMAVKKRVWPQHYINETDFLSEKPACEQRQLRQICGVLIHSLAFELVCENSAVAGFLVMSDMSQQEDEQHGTIKSVFYVDIKDWLSCMKSVAEDEVVSIQCTSQNKKEPLMALTHSKDSKDGARNGT